MSTDNELKPIAPKRKIRRTKDPDTSSKAETPFEEKGDKSETDCGDNGRRFYVDETATESEQDSGQGNKSFTNYEQGATRTLSNLRNKIQCLEKGDELVNSKAGFENDKVVGEEVSLTDDVAVSTDDTLESRTETESVLTAEDGANNPKWTCPKIVNVETVDDLPDGRTDPTGYRHAKEKETGHHSSEETDNIDDYPENLNPFAGATSDQDDAADPSGVCHESDIELGPDRKTTKVRPSLYPWRPFSRETKDYKSHMIPGRNTTKTRPSLYPWRPFGEPDYPEELNPFSEIDQHDLNDDQDDLKKGREEDSENHPYIEQRFDHQTPTRNEQNETLAQDTREEQRDILCETEDDNVDAEKPKKIGRGKRFFKTVRRKLRKFWNRLHCT